MNPSEVKVLIVDDFAMMRGIVRRLLKEMGCNHTEEAEDGIDALDLLQTEKFDIVITDINMPRMNGFQLLGAIKADAALQHVPVLMISAETDEAGIAYAKERGVAGYIAKPFTRAMLEDALQGISVNLNLNKE